MIILTIYLFNVAVLVASMFAIVIINLLLIVLRVFVIFDFLRAPLNIMFKLRLSLLVGCYCRCLCVNLSNQKAIACK